MMELKGRVLVYSIVGCPHCMRAKNSLQELNIPYTDVSLDRYPHAKHEIQMRTQKRTVPQIFFNEKHIGGNDDLQELLKNKQMLADALEILKTTPPGPGAPPVPDPSTAVETADSADFECEPDEYAQFVKELRASGIIKDHRSGLRTYKNSFTGKAFVNWVVEKKGLDRETAIEMGQSLIDRHFGHQVKNEDTFQDDEKYYKLLDDDDSTALNSGPMSDCEPRPAGELGDAIRKLILKIYSAFLSEDGRKVNYSGIAASKEFEVYVNLTKELRRVQLEDATREEKLAFFINIYNALVIHANVVNGPPLNLWNRYKFFNTIRYVIGGYAYSLQDIENGVLRANRKGVGMFTRPFGSSDPRLKVALTEHEPLIHFALVCGAKSCPPIKTYSAAGIYEELNLAAESFLGEDGCLIDMKKRQVKLSMILKWYSVDFGRNKDEVLTWVHDHMPEGEKKAQLKELLDSKNYKLTHMTYDWGINA